MDGIVQNIILTADYVPGNRPDYEDLNTDVIVQFENGERYIATFYSYKNLRNMIEELDHLNREDNECPYYKILNMVLVRDFNQGNLMPVIEAMILEGDFQLIFRKM